MSMHALFLALAGAAPALELGVGPEPAGDLLAIRVGRAETVSHGAIPHAVILVEDGKIVTIGQDLPIERGIPVLDRPDWVAMPGLVNAYSRAGLDSSAGDQFTPQLDPTPELYPDSPEFAEILKTGTTTLGLYPAGRGIPGQALVVRPSGDTLDEMLLARHAYLKIFFQADSRAKKRIRDAFEDVDKYAEKLEKAREKWEKDEEKKAKKKKDAKDDEGKNDPSVQPSPFEPPEVDEKVVPFQQLRAGELDALVSVGGAGEYLHWLDVISKEEAVQWSLRVPLTRYSDIYEVKDKLGEKKVCVLTEPELTLHPGTLRQRNLPAELAAAGARLAFVPSSDSPRGHEVWRFNVALIIRSGLDRAVALRAMTLEPATVLGVEGRVGSLEEGKDANILFLSGDPFDVQTEVEAVMLEGKFVKGEVGQ